MKNQGSSKTKVFDGHQKPQNLDNFDGSQNSEEF